MFCPSCGAEYAIELNYCNRCGANLSTAMTASPVNPVINLNKAVAVIGTTMAVLTLGGFLALVMGAVELSKSAGMRTDPIIGLVVMGMLTIMIADIFLARQLSKLIGAALNAPKQQSKRPISALPSATPAELPRPSTARLEPAPSVTENTTRFFEPAYREPSDSEN